MNEQEIQSALNSFDTELQRTMGIIQYCKKENELMRGLAKALVSSSADSSLSLLKDIIPRSQREIVPEALQDVSVLENIKSAIDNLSPNHQGSADWFEGRNILTNQIMADAKNTLTRLDNEMCTLRDSDSVSRLQNSSEIKDKLNRMIGDIEDINNA